MELIKKFGHSTAIQYAACRGNITDLRTIINDWSHDNPHYNSALNGGLYSACRYGHIDIAHFFVGLGSTQFNDGLKSACEGGHVDIAQLMITLGATDFTGAFSTACRYYQTSTMKFMIQYLPSKYEITIINGNNFGSDFDDNSIVHNEYNCDYDFFYTIRIRGQREIKISFGNDFSKGPCFDRSEFRSEALELLVKLGAHYTHINTNYIGKDYMAYISTKCMIKKFIKGLMVLNEDILDGVAKYYG